jgi:predicted ATPase
MRIYFVGSHSVGKTTLARYVSNRYDMALVTEVARAVLAEMEVSLETLRTDMTKVEEYQRRVFEMQVRVEKQAGDRYVSDRSFDNLAYAVEHTLIAAELLNSSDLREYMKWVAEGLVFFVRPHPDLLREDGTRETPRWEAVVRIDAMIKMLLEIHKVTYFPVHTPSMQERVRAIEAVIDLAQRAASGVVSYPVAASSR